MEKGRLEGKVCIVTGGSRGIGAAIATAFAREGARVVIASRKLEGLAQVAEAINAEVPGSAWARACHVGKLEQLQELVSWTVGEVGLPQVLVNNAGTNPYFGPLMGVSDSLWDKTFEVNLKGAFWASRLVADKLVSARAAGSILSIASVVGMRAAPMQGVYGMTKAALISMTQTLAVELAAANIRCNAIAPGLVDTRLSKMLTGSAELTRMFTDKSALKRYAQPEEIAGMAVYLASDESSYVTGQTFCLDGGYTIT